MRIHTVRFMSKMALQTDPESNPNSTEIKHPPVVQVTYTQHNNSSQKTPQPERAVPSSCREPLLVLQRVSGLWGHRRGWVRWVQQV